MKHKSVQFSEEEECNYEVSATSLIPEGKVYDAPTDKSVGKVEIKSGTETHI